MSPQDDSARDPVRLRAERWAAESPFIGETVEEQAPIHPWYQGYTPFVEGQELEEKYGPEFVMEKELRLQRSSSQPLLSSQECQKQLKNTSVAVVGGGLAGLMAAQELGQHGIKVTVFEARPQVGGRVLSNTTFSKGRITEEGAELIGSFHTRWLNLALKYGLACISRMDEDLYEREGLNVKRTLDKPLSMDEICKLDEEMKNRVLEPIARDASQIQHPSQPWLEPGLKQDDNMSVADALTKRYGVKRDERLWKAIEFKLVNDEVAPLDEMNFLGLLCKVKAGQGMRFCADGTDPKERLMRYWNELEIFRCADGCQKLAMGIANEIKSKDYGAKLLLSRAVTHIDLSKQRVVLGSKEVIRGKLADGPPVFTHYDYVILAIPPSVWASVKITADGKDAHPKDEIGLMGMNPAVKFFSDVKERFWIKEKAAPYGGSLTLGQVWEGTDNQTRVGDQGIVLSVFAGPIIAGGAGRRAPTPDEFKKGLRNLYPGYTGNLNKTLFSDWPNVPFIKTGYASPTKGQIFTIGKKLSEPFRGRLFFAGEHTQMDFFGYMEGALRSGERAAETLMLQSCGLLKEDAPASSKLPVITARAAPIREKPASEYETEVPLKVHSSTSYPREAESSFLHQELFIKRSEEEWDPPAEALIVESPFVGALEEHRSRFDEDQLEALEAENPFRHAFEQGRTSLSEPEEFVEEAEQADADNYASHQGDLSERGTFADHEFWESAAALEFEAAGCTGDHELPTFEGELLDSEIWQGTADQIAFRDRVLNAHIALSRKRAGAAKRDLSPKELDDVAGTNIKMVPEAAAAAGRLLAAANADLAKDQAAGDPDALRTIRLSATSGYRGSAHQKTLWLNYFTAKGGYYDRTQAARERLADGPHSEQAVTYMLTPKEKGGFGLSGRIAAPGYSNHQGGIAIDFWQERKKGYEILNDSSEKARDKWRSTWFHKWLRNNAANFFFQPIPTEEWHWEYRRGSGITASASAATSTDPSIVAPTTPPTSSPAQPTAELVRFAQRVLNAAESERLSDDGVLGRLTRAALERFRKKYGLGMGDVLDVSTELALAQRALEELAQASMFAQPGTRDARTEQALITFKSTRQLSMDAKLDAATRRALTDALARMVPKPRASVTAPQTPASASPATYLGGKLWTFEAKTLPMRVAVFCPQAALSLREVEVLVYAHGLLNGCKRPKSIPDGMIADAPFKLGDIVAASGRPIVLVVPYLDWANPGGESAFGRGRRKWHALGKPAHLNSLIAEVLAELGRVQSITTPSLRNLVIAGHSRAYDFLEPLAYSYSDPQMQQGALARLSQVWAFDSTYAGDVNNWMSWLNANPGLQVSVFYTPGSKTGTVGDAFFGKRSARLAVIKAKEDHCAVPARRLPALLKPPVSATDQETEAPWGEDELVRDEVNLRVEEYAPEAYKDETSYGQNATDVGLFYREFDGESFESAEKHYEVDRFDPWDKLDADEHYLSAEPELDALAFEALGSDDLHVSDDEEFEDEDYADQVLEEEASDKNPLPVPVGNPVPFAPLPPMGSYWPVGTSRKDAREVSYMYQAPSGIVGRAGRMFLAGRKGERDGKQALRWHVGVDLFANIKDVVVACEDGTIVDFSFFYNAKSGQRTYKLLIQHDGSGVVVNYGEVTGDSLRKNGLEVGKRVVAGQPIGFVSDTSMLHFETYIKGTTTSHRWWKDEKTPPRQLLNPTRYLLFLRKHGLSSTQDAGTQPAPTRPASTSTKTPAELVRFAQRVLNAIEATGLDDDGVLGRLTRGALERFRRKYDLGTGGVLDVKTQIALAQRALEEIAQQSIFPQLGVLDVKTEQALMAFRSDRGLGFNATLDAATRAALADALARHVNVPSAPLPVATPSGLPKLDAGLVPPTDPKAYRKFRLTTYYVVDQGELPMGAVHVPIYDDSGRKIAKGGPAFFAQLSLEGTARLNDGRLINVTGKTIPVSHDEYAEVLAYHRQAYAKSDEKRREEGKKLTPTTYSGIVVENDRVVRAFAFHEVPASRRGIGYGLLRGIPLVPFRTLAADIGVKEKHDKNWKGKGGLVPPGTHVYIKEYDRLLLPDGTTHDGWFIVNDTGGAIFGAHFDVFVDARALGKLKLPEFGQVWFAGIEQRIPPGYTYGLKKS